MCCAALLKVDNMLDVEVEDEVRTRQRVCRWPTGQERGDQWGPRKMLQRTEASSRGRDEGCNELGLAGLASKLCWWWVGLKRLGVGESRERGLGTGVAQEKVGRGIGDTGGLDCRCTQQPRRGQGSQEGTAAPGHVQHRGARWTIQPGREH